MAMAALSASPIRSIRRRSAMRSCAPHRNSASHSTTTSTALSRMESATTSFPPRPCEKAMFKSLCGSAVEFAGGLDFHMERGSGGPHSLDERLHPEDGDHPLQIVGENVKAHLRADLFEGGQPEVGRAHPRLDGSEWMFRALASDAHAPRSAV